MVKLPAYYITKDDDKVMVRCSDGTWCHTGDYRELYRYFTHSNGVYPSVPRVCWSLRDVVPILLSVAPQQAQQEISDEHPHRATWEDDGIRYRLFIQYSASDDDAIKFFGINTGESGDHREINLYELDQFYPEEQEVNSVDDVSRLADELAQTFAILGVRNLTNLSSPVRALEESGALDKVYKTLPDPSSIPVEVNEMAIDVDTWAVWQGNYQVGYWDNAWSYDISSCYPSWAVRLLTLDGAEYKHTKEILRDASYGYVKGTMHIDPTHAFAFCSPIVAPAGDVQTNPVGKIKGTFTIDQVRYIEKYHLGDVDIKDGWFIYPKQNVRPLADIMTVLFGQRELSPLMSYLGKRVLNGIIGRFGEYRKDKPVSWTNPVYHSTIRTRASLQVGKFLINNDVKPDELIYVNTDGNYLTREIKLPGQADMGEWRCDGQHRVLSLSPHHFYRDDRCDELVDMIKSDGTATRYNLVSLTSLAAEQSRVFPQYPKTGTDVLRNHYIGGPVLLE